MYKTRTHYFGIIRKSNFFISRLGQSTKRRCVQMTQKGGMNETKGIESKDSNTGNALNDEIIEELGKISVYLDTHNRKTN